MLSKGLLLILSPVSNLNSTFDGWVWNGSRKTRQTEPVIIEFDGSITGIMFFNGNSYRSTRLNQFDMLNRACHTIFVYSRQLIKDKDQRR